MGRKKRKGAQLKPFCYYCEREFDDEKVLIQHQKAKHFKCSECNRKLDTATGLVVHMLQVHKETISRVPNANPGRDNPDDIIHGMAGVPVELLNEKQSKLDEERGAAKHQKSAHTVFGMSVMSGFFNQMNAAGGGRQPGFSPFGGMPGGAMPSGFPGPAGANPFTFSQFMAQMSQSPQAAFNALTNGAIIPSSVPSSTPVGGNAGFPGAVMPPLGGVSGADSTSALSSTSSLTPVFGGSSSGGFRSSLGVGKRDDQTPGTSSEFSSAWSAAPPPPPVTGPAALSCKLGFGLSSALGLAKQSKPIFQPSDDTISPEEILAMKYDG